MPEKPKPLKFESLQKLITNAEGKRATYEGSRKMPNGDLEIKYEEICLGIRERGNHLAYHCPTCKGFYFGPAPLNARDERYCEGCDNTL